MLVISYYTFLRLCLSKIFFSSSNEVGKFVVVDSVIIDIVPGIRFEFILNEFICYL